MQWLQICTFTALACLWSRVLLLMEYLRHFEWTTSDHCKQSFISWCMSWGGFGLGTSNCNAHSFSPFQLYHYHRSLYYLWTGLLCCHYCCWSCYCGRAAWKTTKIIILLDEERRKRVQVLPYSLVLHFAQILAPDVQSSQWQLPLLKHTPYKGLVTKQPYKEHNISSRVWGLFWIP